MMTIATTGSVLLAAALQSSAPSTGAVDLFCRGNGDRFVTTQTKVRQVDGSIKTLTDNRRVPFDSAIRIRIVNGKGQALIPDQMLADDDPRGWHEIKKLAVTGQTITGKVHFNWQYSPVLTLDRRSSVLKITGSMANFMGRCGAFDPRTSIMPAPGRRQARPGYASPSAPNAGYGQDSRSAARAMAGRAGSREAARGAALKADLAFRLFNASNVPIVELAMIGTNGTPSANWLKGGVRVAPQTFKAMTFAAGRACTHRVRITYANGTRAVQSINFCGKDVLYANGGDLWAE